MATVTVDYGDGIETTWTMSKFMVIGAVVLLETEYGEGRTAKRGLRGVWCPVHGGFHGGSVCSPEDFEGE